MKALIIATAGFLALGLPAYAQSPSNNATTSGTATTPGNSAGAPAASTPPGQVATTGGVVSASPPAVQQARPTALSPTPAPTADSTTTGTTPK